MGGPGSLFFVIVLTLAGVALGVVLMLFGRRARRVDDHPLCRRCRFDLYGLGDKAATCPECGAPLALAGAVRVGNRRPSVALVTLGVLLVLMSIAVGGGVVAVRRGTDPNRYKPAWLLVREARAANAPAGDAFLNELIRRLRAGQLSSGRIRSVVAEALERQADPNAAWSPAWGDFVDAAWISGNVTPEHRAQYLVNGVEFSLIMRSRAPQGHPMAMRLDGKIARLSSSPHVSLRYELARLDVDGAVIPATLSGGCTLDAGGFTATWSDMRGEIDAELGLKTLTTVWRVSLVQDTPEDPTGERAVTLTAPITIVGPNESPIALRTDAEWRERIRSAIVVESLTFNRSLGACSLTLMSNDLPCFVMADMILREQNPLPGTTAREWSMGVCQMYPGPGLRSSGWEESPMMDAETFDLQSVEVVLRPRLMEALLDPAIDNVWGEEIVIPEVVVGAPSP